MGCHLVAHLLLRLLGPISSTPHHILALALSSVTTQHTHSRGSRTSSCSHFLQKQPAAHHESRWNELYPTELPHVLQQHDLGLCSGQQCDFGLCGGGTSEAAARPLIWRIRPLHDHFSTPFIPSVRPDFHLALCTGVSSAYAPKWSCFLQLIAVAHGSKHLIMFFCGLRKLFGSWSQNAAWWANHW
jgi:hypothetical protein